MPDQASSKLAAPIRRRYTLSRLVAIPPDTILRRSSKSPRPSWHIDGRDGSLCGLRPLERFDMEMTYGAGPVQICRNCHGKLSWTDEPVDYVIEDRGFETPCLIWTRGGDARGYGRRGSDGKWFYVHREAYERAYGEIPAGWVVHHLCEQKACINPSHLEAMPIADHVRHHSTKRAR